MAQRPIALRASAARQGEDIRAARCGGFFPLTPALSLGERVNPSLRGEQSRAVGFPLRDARSSLSLSEGERVRVRGGLEVLKMTIPNVGAASSQPSPPTAEERETYSATSRPLRPRWV